MSTVWGAGFGDGGGSAAALVRTATVAASERLAGFSAIVATRPCAGHCVHAAQGAAHLCRVISLPFSRSSFWPFPAVSAHLFLPYRSLMVSDSSRGVGGFLGCFTRFSDNSDPIAFSNRLYDVHSDRR